MPPDRPSGRHAAGASHSGSAFRQVLKDRVAATLLDDARERVRVRLESGHAVVIVLLAAVAVGASLLLLQAARPDTEQVADVRPTVASTGQAIPVAEDAEAVTSPAAVVLIHVAGRVGHPGVVKLPAGSRVVDAIEAAGGVDNGVDLTALNLARVLVDGEQVLVGVEPPPGAQLGPAGPGGGAVGPGASGGSGGASGSGASGLVNLNTATQEQLETLPGVGPVLAGRILKWREENGRFTSIDELREISGIGPRIFEGLADLVQL